MRKKKRTPDAAKFGRMKLPHQIHQREAAKDVQEDSIAKRGSNQGRTEGTGPQQCRGDLNSLLEKEAQELTQAARYERTESRQGYRSMHYSRNLTTTSGDVTLKAPRLKNVPYGYIEIRRESAHGQIPLTRSLAT